jgi:hypothetical protein
MLLVSSTGEARRNRSATDILVMLVMVPLFIQEMRAWDGRIYVLPNTCARAAASRFWPPPDPSAKPAPFFPCRCSGECPPIGSMKGPPALPGSLTQGSGSGRLARFPPRRGCGPWGYAQGRGAVPARGGGAADSAGRGTCHRSGWHHGEEHIRAVGLPPGRGMWRPPVRGLNH